MSDESDESESAEVEELYVGEKVEGESVQEEEKAQPPRDVIHVIFPKVLTRTEAGKCLCRLGKPVNGSGLQLAYLMIKVNDMKVTNIDVIADFPYLMFIDVCGNFLRKDDLHVLQKLDYVLMIKADDNRLDNCILPKFPYLQVLTLNKNRITKIEGLDHQNLKCLELNYNKLTEATGLNPFKLRSLQYLELRGNSLTTTVGIYCQSIEILILCENLIESIRGLEVLKNLRVLHLRDNPLKVLDGFTESMEKLTYLNLRSCQISSLKEVEKLKVLPKLNTLVLWDNPLVDVLGANYRLHIINMFPHVKRIDKGGIRSEEIHFAKELRHRQEVAGEYGEEEEEEMAEEEEDESDDDNESGDD